MSRARILAAVADEPSSTAADLAADSGMDVVAVSRRLLGLYTAGAVERKRIDRPGLSPVYVYTLPAEPEPMRPVTDLESDILAALDQPMSSVQVGGAINQDRPAVARVPLAKVSAALYALEISGAVKSDGATGFPMWRRA